MFPPPASLEYRYIVLPTKLTEDRWILASEVRPGNRAVIHHVNAFIREPGSTTWLANAKPGVIFVAHNEYHSVDLSVGITSYVPGLLLRPANDGPRRAILIKAGSDIVLQLHYAPNGKATTDRTKVGFIFAKGPPQTRLVQRTSALIRFSIPPGDPDYKLEAISTLPYDCDLFSLTPHAHLRGKSFEYRVIRPDGSSETVLSVPNTTLTGSLPISSNTDAFDERYENRSHRSLRQLGQQPSQSRSHPRSALGRADQR